MYITPRNCPQRSKQQYVNIKQPLLLDFMAEWQQYTIFDYIPSHPMYKSKHIYYICISIESLYRSRKSLVLCVFNVPLLCMFIYSSVYCASWDGPLPFYWKRGRRYSIKLCINGISCFFFVTSLFSELNFIDNTARFINI